MTDAGIPDEVRAFIAEHIDSVEQVEVLLLLRRSGDREWTADAVSDELRTNPGSAAERLADLTARRLIAPAGGAPERPGYRYAPGTPALDQAVRGLDQAYAERRVSVINLIFSKPIDKIRTFADAFRLRKDGRDG